MRQVPTAGRDDTAATDIEARIAAFARAMRAENKSPGTLDTYTRAAGQLAAFLAERGMPRDVAHIRREHIESLIEDLRARRKPATANNRFRGCQRFFASPARRGAAGAPGRLRGWDFEERRDAAILSIFMDTGARRAEVAGLRGTPGDETNHDVDLHQGILRVTGKGRRERVLPVGAKTVCALDRYLRLRAKHLPLPSPGSGSGSAGASPTPASGRWSESAGDGPGSAIAFIRISSGTPSPTPG